MDANHLGGYLGGAVGVLGGLIGTAASISRAKAGPERRLMIRFSIGLWIGVSLFTAAIFLVPSSWKWLLWVLYGPAIGFSILWMNKRLAAIRRTDSGESKA